jgi:hypothetical protein
MGSAKHPRLFSVDEMESLRTAFHEIYDAIQGQNVFRPATDDDDELKALIIRKLVEVIEAGTPPAEFRSKVLRSLPLR